MLQLALNGGLACSLRFERSLENAASARQFPINCLPENRTASKDRTVLFPCVYGPRESMFFRIAAVLLNFVWFFALNLSKSAFKKIRVFRISIYPLFLDIPGAEDKEKKRKPEKRKKVQPWSDNPVSVYVML